MKKLLFLAVIITSLAIPASVCAGDVVNVVVNGEAVDFTGDQAPVIQDGRTLVPFRAVFEKMGAEVKWFEDIKLCEATYADTTVGIVIGESKVSLGDFEEVEGDVPAQIINGRTMVPLRVLSESIGADVGWDNATKTVTVDTPEIMGEAPVVANYNIKKDFISGNVTVNYEYPEVADVYTAANILNKNIKTDIADACAQIADTAVTEKSELDVTCRIKYNDAGIFSVMYYIDGETVYWNHYTTINGARLTDDGYAFITRTNSEDYEDVEAVEGVKADSVG